MSDIPMTTSIAIPGRDMPDLQEPIVVSAEQSVTAVNIRDGLLSDARLGGVDLQVRMSGDNAVISGDVRTEDQRDVALSIAGHYVGPDHVKDDMQTGDQISYFCEA